jgi:hypothetical protein
MTVTDDQVAAGVARLRAQRTRDGQSELVESDHPYELLTALLTRAPDDPSP